MTDALTQFAGGLRLALVLLAIMATMTRVRGGPRRGAKRTALVLGLKVRAEALLTAGVLIYSPMHTAWLLGYPVPHWINRAADVAASGLACGTFVLLIAARGLRRGLSAHRVRAGAYANMLVVAATVVVACLVR